MTYKTELITLRADCDTLLDFARDKKKALEFQQASIERQIENYGDRTVEIETELITVSAQLEAFAITIPKLPEGKNKEEEITRQKKLEVRQRQLDAQKDEVGVLALLKRQFELACVLKELDEVAIYIAALEARRAQLTA